MSDSPAPSPEDIYSAALSLPADQRNDYVAAQCSDLAAREELLRRLADRTVTFAASGHAGRRAAPAISAGTRLGHYLIQRPLGSGGMGFVYEALDESLNRTVAVKVLPMGRYDDASRKRFRREAESASALNHPNIITVHEVGREGEIDFIAMERVSGQTLREMAGRRPMPLRKALGIAAQIADALAAAHEAGIVHRDLKPANVMVSDRGIVKVLDFGLAKQAFSAGGATEPVEGEISRVGEVMGTISYMSPEQAEGKPVDARSDIFAFGSVLYEMVTGRRAFHRESSLTTMAAIVTSEPKPVRHLLPQVPKLLESIIQKCLRKQPYERWQSLADVKLMLQDLAADPDTDSERATGGDEPAMPNRRWLWYVVAAAVASAALTLGLQSVLRPAASPAALATLRMVTTEKGLSTAPALSPDGSLLAFASDRSNQGNLDIWLQQVGGSEPLRLTSDPADETDPSFSSDGARVAFRSEKGGGGIYVMPALGGDATGLAPQGRNPRFSPDGKSIAFWVGREGSLVPGSSKPFLVDLAGGAPRVLETGLAWAQYPIWSPDGSSLIVYGMSGTVADRSAVDWWIVPPGGGKAKPVGIRQVILPLIGRTLPEALNWFAGEDGPQVLFAQDAGDNSNLWRMGLKPDGKVGGAPVRVTNGPGRQVAATLSRSKEGSTRLAYADQTINYDVWRLPVHPDTGLASGPLQAVTDRLSPEMNPTLSGDGKQLYFITTRLGTWSIVRKDLDANRERILFNSPEYLYNTRVASLGSRLFFSSRPSQLFAIPANGGVVEKLCAGCGSVTGVSPQGDRVLIEPTHDDHLMMFDVASGQVIKLADRGAPNLLLSGGQFSPDGKWVAFSATNNDTRESAVYVVPISGPTRPVPRDQWILVTGESDLSRDPLFASAGPFLYFTSEKDGFRCLWAQRLHPDTRVPLGEAIPVQHFHTSRLAIRTRAGSGNIIGLSAGGNQLVFALAEITGNIWIEESKSVQ